ncbi:phage tail-collar fiber domain-containing protein [Pasteurella bettyae]|nr:phage tail protein [Pasteurella bettyae]SUB20772.1 Phage tail fibre repeat [Pasteurella bettyae]
MTKNYYAVITEYGQNAIAQATANKQPLQITHMAVGDGNGKAITPTDTATKLTHEVYRNTISAIQQDPKNPKQIIFELTIPESSGGYYVREMGIFDNKNKLVAIANCPESYKPQLDNGSGKIQILRMILLFSSSDNVTLTVDDSVIFITRQQFTPKTINDNSQNGYDETGHSHFIEKATTSLKGITKLNSSTDSNSESEAATPKAVKTAFDAAKTAKTAADNAQQTANGKWTATDATTSQKGITKLNSSTNSNSESEAATPKAIKIIKDLIDALTRNLNNYIPNSKKSNAINSNSADTVATSVAVKTAYDLANTKVSKSGDTMTDVLIFDTKNWAQTKYTTQGGIWRFEVAPAGDLASNTARFNYVFVDNTGAERSRIAFNQSTGTSIVAYQGWVGDNYLPLSGGSLRGELSLPTLKVTANNTGKGIEIGDDAIVADVKLSNSVGIVGKQQADKGYISFGYNAAASKPLAYIGYDGKKLHTSDILYQGNTKYALVTDIPNLTSESVYASHYDGAKVLKIKTTNTGWKIIKMQVDKMTVPGDGVLTLNLPEATTDAVISAIDNGNARFSYGGKMDGTNKIKIYAPKNAIVGINIIIIGGL